MNKTNHFYQNFNQWLDRDEHIQGSVGYQGCNAIGYKYSRTELLNAIQIRLHRLLEGFLNGVWFINWGWANWFLKKKQSTSYENIISELRYFFGKVLATSEFDKLFEPVNDFKKADQACLAEFIGFAYSLWEKQLKLLEIQPKNIETVSIQPLNITDHTALREKPIINLVKQARIHLPQFFSHAILHGSLSTQDTTYYSDADILLITNKETILNPTALLSAQKTIKKLSHYLYQYDPTQHHGFMIIAEQDLSYYPQVFLPVVVYRKAKNIFCNEKDLVINLRSDMNERAELFWNTVQVIRREWKLKQPRTTEYGLKLFLSWLQILPIYYLQVKNIWTYKSDSFELARKNLRGTNWEAIDLATSLRAEWPKRSYRLHQLMWDLLKATGLDALAIQWIIEATQEKLGKKILLSGFGDFVYKSVTFAENMVDDLRDEKTLS